MEAKDCPKSFPDRSLFNPTMIFHYLPQQNSHVPDKSEEDELQGDSSESEGPWVLVASGSGLGKRVPMTQFRLQIEQP